MKLGTVALLALTVVLVILKLCHVVSWSWWVVTSPLWAPVAFCFGVLLLANAIAIATRVH